MKIFIFGFTYVPKVKGQPCLHFSSEHIFSILYHLSIRVLVKLFTSLYLKHPPAPFLFYGMSPASPSFYLWISPLFFWQPVLLLISQSFFFKICPVLAVHKVLRKSNEFFFFLAQNIETSCHKISADQFKGLNYFHIFTVPGNKFPKLLDMMLFPFCPKNISFCHLFEQ